MSYLTDENGALYVKDMVPEALCNFLTHVLLVCRDRGVGVLDDGQVKNTLSVSHEYVFETLLEIIWPFVETAVGEELLPTYAYARLYENGAVLKPHIDRPACEISVTIQLGRSHHYAWPLYMGKQRFDMAEGDGVIYKGDKILHWRNICDGPENYYSGQVFLHFVRKNGQFAQMVGDQEKRDCKSIVFVKNRTVQMCEK